MIAISKMMRREREPKKIKIINKKLNVLNLIKHMIL